MPFERKNPKKQAAAVVNVRVLTAVLSRRLHVCVALMLALHLRVPSWHRDRSVVFASSLAVRAERAKGGG